MEGASLETLRHIVASGAGITVLPTSATAIKYIAPLPDGYAGDFGPSIKALVLDMHHHEKLTESAIHHFLTTHGIKIGKASISRILTDNHEPFHEEKKDIVEAGLQSTDHQQIDDTSARVNGKNHYVRILCNDFYTAYFTRKDKTRLTIIDILTNGDMKFIFNESAYDLMLGMGLSNKMLDMLLDYKKNPSDELSKKLMPISMNFIFILQSEKIFEATKYSLIIRQNTKALNPNLKYHLTGKRKKLKY